MSDWISVEDRLPDSSGTFLAFRDNRYISSAFFTKDRVWLEMWAKDILNIIYWMPLPEPPNE